MTKKTTKQIGTKNQDPDSIFRNALCLKLRKDTTKDCKCLHEV